MQSVLQPRFMVGQMVQHTSLRYRGVVVDIDERFNHSDAWYRTMARSRPPKDQPWYRILIHEKGHDAYVSEGLLELDDSGEPIDHPFLDMFFEKFQDGYYHLIGPEN